MPRRRKRTISGFSKKANLTPSFRKKVYARIENNKGIKGKRGRRYIKALAKQAYKEGNVKLSRGLWAMHTRRSAFAAGVKAAKSRRR